MQDLVGQRRTPWRERGGMGVTVVVCCVCVCVRDGESFGSGGGFNIGIGIEHWEKRLGSLSTLPEASWEWWDSWRRRR